MKNFESNSVKNSPILRFKQQIKQNPDLIKTKKLKSDNIQDSKSLTCVHYMHQIQALALLSKMRHAEEQKHRNLNKPQSKSIQ